MHRPSFKHFLTAHRFYCSVGLIIGMALFLRGWQFGSLPGSLYFEEPALGYDAYSIFKTGKDMHGNSWPIVAFPSFGDYKPSGYFYLAAPFVGIWGMNEVTVRLPSLILGLVTVAMVMALSQGIFRNRTTTLLSGLAIAVMPTAVHLSRAAFEVNAAVGLLSMALAGLVWAKKFPKLLLASVFPLAASMYTYHSLRLVAPLVYVLTFLMYGNPKKALTQKITWVSLFLFVVLIWPMLIAIRSPEVAHRYQEVSFFPFYSQAVETTNRLRAEHHHALWSRLVYHRYWFQGFEFLTNLAKHFSIEFLVIKGDGNARHQDPTKGIIFVWMMISIAAGIALKIIHKSGLDKTFFYCALFILICLIPSSLAMPVPHTLRSYPMVIVLPLLVSWAIWTIKEKLRLNRIITITLMVAALSEVVFFWLHYFSSYNSRYPSDWMYGFKELVQFVQQSTRDNESIFIDQKKNRPATYFFFYNAINPVEIQSFSKKALYDQKEFLNFRTIDFRDQGIVYLWEIYNEPKNPEGYALHTLIKDSNHHTAFYVYKKQ